MVILEVFVQFLQVSYSFYFDIFNEINEYDDIVPCASAPCENGGKCELLIGNTYGCVCPEEYTGSRCETHTISK